MPSDSPILVDARIRAAGHLRAGRLDEAEHACRQALELSPQDFNALNFLGMCSVLRGQHLGAISYFSAALDSYPSGPGAWFNRGTSMQALARYEAAIEDYSRALALKPDYLEALCNRASAYQALGRNALAIADYDSALKIAPIAEALCNRGVSLGAMGNHEGAIADYDRALLLKPDYSKGHFCRAHALQALDRHSEALEGYDAAIQFDPNSAEAYCNRAITLHALHRYDAALQDCEHALKLQAYSPHAWTTRGVALHALNRHNEAIESFDRALALAPTTAEALCNRAFTMQALGRPMEAVSDCNRALTIRANYSEAAYIKAHCLLGFGLSEPALKLYEQRLGSKFYRNFPDFGLPLLGEVSPHGQSILIQWEQRFGDVIQMLRYVPLLERVASECSWQIDPALKRLAGRSFPFARFIDPTESPAHLKFRLPYTSLPLAMRTFANASIPNTIPYLVADMARAVNYRLAWRANLALPLIAIAWRGNDDPPNRSITLEELRPLFESTGYRFVAIQKEITSAELESIAQWPNALSAHSELSDFDDTAAVLAAVDLVITIDTAMAHLAGALGRPTWALLKHGADSRWLLQRDDSPWYPTMRLFRQERLGDWETVIERVRVALEAWTQPNSDA